MFVSNNKPFLNIIMKKTFIAILLSVSITTLFAQQDTVYLKKESQKKIITDRAPQVFFTELGGPGLAISVNYDRRFNKEIGGLGYRAGLGYSFDRYFKFTTIPLGINYLMGDKNRGRFFELGLNGTLLITGENNNNYYRDVFTIGDVEVNNNTLFITSITMGYRSQPTKGGFNFRGGLLPFIVQSEPGIGAYLSFGYNF